MLTLALPGEVLEFKGPVLVKANKSQGQILWNLKFLFFLIFFNFSFNPNFLNSFFHSFTYFITYYSI